MSTSASLLRSTLSVIVGYVIFSGSAVALFQLSGVDPHGPSGLAFKAWATAYGVVFAWLAGRATVRLASSESPAPIMVVAGLVALGALVSLVARPGEGAVWTQLEAVILFTPLIIAGGLAARRRSATNQDQHATSSRIPDPRSST